MNVFIAVAEKNSFAEAARRLDLSPSAVTRAVRQLENNLNVTLLKRSTRSVQLTETGQIYLEQAKGIVTLLNTADAAARGVNIAPHGHLKVTAPVLFGRSFVMPGIAEYLLRFPEMKVTATFVDRAVNLIDEGFDVAIRIGQLPDSGMKALRLGQVRRVVFASPTYLAKRGVPTHPSDLQRHTIIGTEAPAQQINWRFRSQTSSVSVKLTPRLNTLGSDAAIVAARSGLGIAQLPLYQIASLVETGELKLILADYAGEALPVHLLHLESKFAAAKVRSFIDLLGTRLRSDFRLQ